MKPLLPIVLFLSMLPQTAYGSRQQYDKDPLSPQECKALIRARGYEAMGTFDTLWYGPDVVLAVYIKGGKFGLIDPYGKEVTPARYSEIPSLDRDNFNYQRCKHPVLIVKTDAYGLIDLEGKELVAPAYHYISHTTESVEHTDEDPRNGLSITNGYEVFYKDVGFQARLSSHEGVQLDLKGNRLPRGEEPTHDGIEEIVEIEEDWEFGTVSTGNASSHLPNYGRVWTQRTGNFVGYKNESTKKCGIMNVVTGDTIIPFEYDAVHINYMSQFGLTFWDSVSNNRILKQRHGLVDSSGHILFEPIYEQISRFNEVYLLVKDGKLALYDLELKPLSDFEYGAKMGSGNGDYVALQKGDRWGLVDMRGKAITEFTYDGFYFPEDHDLPHRMIIAQQDGKEALMDYEGRIIVPPKYTTIFPECNVERGKHYPFREGGRFIANRTNRYFYVGMGTGERSWDGQVQKYGLLDSNYQQIIPCEYDAIYKGSKDVLIVKKDQKYALLNWRSKQLISDWEDHKMEEIAGLYFLYRKNGLYGFTDQQGVTVIPFAYAQPVRIEHSYPGLLKVYDYSGLEDYYDSYGNRAQVRAAAK